MNRRKQTMYLPIHKFKNATELTQAVMKKDSTIKKIESFDFQKIKTDKQKILIISDEAGKIQYQLRLKEYPIKAGVLLLILLFILGAIGYYVTITKSNDVSESPAIIPAGIAPEGKDAKPIDKNELIKRMQQKVDEGYFNLNLDTEMIFATGTYPGKISIINAAENPSILAVKIYLSESKQLLYETGSIYPGEYIDEGKALIPLKKGRYPAYGIVEIYDRQTKKKLTESRVEMTIIVQED